mgnify:CR=1 FL=1
MVLQAGFNLKLNSEAAATAAAVLFLLVHASQYRGSGSPPVVHNTRHSVHQQGTVMPVQLGRACVP